MAGGDFLAALMKGGAKKPAAKAPVAVVEEEAPEDDMGAATLAGAVRSALDGGDDAALARALKDFIEAC